MTRNDREQPRRVVQGVPAAPEPDQTEKRPRQWRRFAQTRLRTGAPRKEERTR